MTTSTTSRIRQTATLALALGLAASGLDAQVAAPAAARLPPTLPTGRPANAEEPAPITATSATVAPGAPIHAGTVTYAAGMLNVRADNSSLNQILREICRLTGMTITGGVADERVFGNYGPAEPSTILATLLGGTGSNMLLRETADNAPAELILTPRNGGPTPPNPNAPGFDNERGAGPHSYDRPGLNRPGYMGRPGMSRTVGPRPAIPPPQAMPPANDSSSPQPPAPTFNNVNGSPSNTSPTASTLPVTNSVPADSLPAPTTTPPTSGIVDAPNPPPTGSTTSAPPSGTQTPQQIFQQLQKLRQQQRSATGQPAPQPAPQ